MINCVHFYEAEKKQCAFKIDTDDQCKVCFNHYSSNYIRAFEDNCNQIGKQFYQQLDRGNISLKVRPDETDADKLHVTERDPYERDYTRILYSPSFRRLQGKMQLLGLKSHTYYRNRLTHSLEVAQIARSIAMKIGYPANELYVVEAGALAHDIGNPPFGHYGEKILNQLAKDIGGFEGNAQTLRILRSLEKKNGINNGLDLTARTLLSVLKYNKTLEQANKINSKKFIYKKDYDALQKYVKILGNTRSLDVQIVDISDEIAYAAHDLEDGLAQNMFDINQILIEFKRLYNNNSKDEKVAIDTLTHLIENSRKHASDLAKSSGDFPSIFRTKLSSQITHILIHDIGIVELSSEDMEEFGTSSKFEIGFLTLKKLAKGLKKITFKCITNTDDVYYYEQAGQKIIEGLYMIYSKFPKYLPPEYRVDNVDILIATLQGEEDDLKEEDRLKVPLLKEEQARKIIDYIAGMMDSYAINQYIKFFDENPIEGIYGKANNINKPLWYKGE